MTLWIRGKTLSLYTNQAAGTETVRFQGMRMGYFCVDKESEGPTFGEVGGVVLLTS